MRGLAPHSHLPVQGWQLKSNKQIGKFRRNFGAAPTQVVSSHTGKQHSTGSLPHSSADPIVSRRKTIGGVWSDYRAEIECEKESHRLILVKMMSRESSLVFNLPDETPFV